jgi:hypothetical protein
LLAAVEKKEGEWEKEVTGQPSGFEQARESFGGALVV